MRRAHPSAPWSRALPVLCALSLLGVTAVASRPAVAVDGRAGWTVTADSEEVLGEDGRALNVLDGNPATIWHTRWSGPEDPLPHTLTIDTKQVRTVSGFTYVPRPASTGRNGAVGQYRIELSVDGTTWTAAASGTLADTSATTTITFAAASARYVRLVALSEAGNRGPWTSAAEIDLVATSPPPAPTPTPTPTPTGLPDRTQWVATADSQETVGEDGRAANALDGNAATLWHTRWSGTTDPLPHRLTIDTLARRTVSGLVYQPRPASTGRNGNLGQYRVELSLDGVTWSAPVASGTLPDDSATRTIAFPAAVARYVRLTALSEAGNRGPWTSAAEVDLVTGPLPPSGTGAWTAPIRLPLVPAAVAVLPNGNVLAWSSYAADTFGVGTGKTQTATYDVTTGAVSARTVTETGHDMFCPGTALLSDGTLLVNGGSDSAKTSLYDAATATWSAAAPLAIPRGYQSAVTLADGSVFTLGGSWNGGIGGKNGELWTRAGGSRVLPGAPVAPILTNDPQGEFRSDNHPWLFTWTGGRVFHAGPSRAMGWYGTTANGSYSAAGTRGDDGDAMNGNAVMYDTGKILTVGGAPGYQNSVATANANVIDLTGSAPVVRKLAPMHSARAFANSVVLPDGSVLVVGGQAYAKPYSDATAAMRPELWQPATGTFTELAPMAVPRNYHSAAVLLADGRVFAGGGGMCAGCGTDHLDAEIYTPPYLLDANGLPRARPAITSAPAKASHGTVMTVNTSRPVTAFSLVRMSANTHSVNTDQRRLPLRIVRSTGTSYQLMLPADTGVLVPGAWMLFALDGNGVPSVAATMLVS